MNNSNGIMNIKSLFKPLGFRLYYFESKNYLTQFEDFENEEISGLAIPPDTLMRVIGTEANEFSFFEVRNECKIYLKRIVSIMEELQSPVKKIRYDFDKGQIVETNFSKEDGERLCNQWMQEFTSYQKELQSILDVRSGIEEDSQGVVVELKEVRKISDFDGHFKAKLSHNQAALFLYILKKSALIPYYHDTTLGIIGMQLFASHEQRIRSSLGEKLWSKQDIKRLVEILKELEVKLGTL